MSTLPRVFERLAKQTAKQIVFDAGTTREERISELTEHADEMNGHLLTKTALESLVPLNWESSDRPGSEAVERFWLLFRPLVIVELKLALEPFRKPVKAEWNRRNKAMKEGREW